MKRFLLILLLLLPVVGQTQTRKWTASETKLKAAMLLNFGRFIKFPTQPTSIRICVLGSDPFGAALDSVSGKKVQGTYAEIFRYEQLEAAVNDCSILFISSSESHKTSKIFDFISDKAILTVGEMDSFAENGGMVGLVNQGSIIKFKVNLQQATSKGIKFSSRLLQLAYIIE